MAYNTDDSQKIWESFQHRSNRKNDPVVQELFEQDIQYVTDFLIKEGLLDSVKSGFGKVKDFASQKLLQPIVNMAMKALAKMDPDLAQRLASAAESGDDAQLQQLLAPGQQEADNITAQVNQQAVPESYNHEITLNTIICDALVESNIITSQHAQVIQEKYFCTIINELHVQMNQDAGCPWHSADVIVSENTGTEVAKQVTDLMKQAYANNKNFRPNHVWKQLMKTNPKFAEFVSKQGNTQPVPAGQPVDIDGDGQPEDAASEDTPPVNPPAPAQGEQPPAPAQGEQPPAPAQGESQQKGILSKVWNYVSKNKITSALGALGLISIAAAALPIGGALAPVIAGAAAAAKVGAVTGGTIGAVKGAVDDLRKPGQDGETGLSRFKSAASAGIRKGLEGAAKGAGAAAIAGGIGGAAGSGVTADPATTTEPTTSPTDAPPAEPAAATTAAVPDDFMANAEPGYADQSVSDAGVQSSGASAIYPTPDQADNYLDTVQSQAASDPSNQSVETAPDQEAEISQPEQQKKKWHRFGKPRIGHGPGRT